MVSATFFAECGLLERLEAYPLRLRALRAEALYLVRFVFVVVAVEEW
jgi:hypothetical protein